MSGQGISCPSTAWQPKHSYLSMSLATSFSSSSEAEASTEGASAACPELAEGAEEAGASAFFSAFGAAGAAAAALPELLSTHFTIFWRSASENCGWAAMGTAPQFPD